MQYLCQTAKFFCIHICLSFAKNILEQFFIHYKSSVVNLSVCGNGAKKLFCFHGYGESGLSFSVLEPLLANSFTMYCIDFPFHGKTVWKENELFAPKDLIHIIQRVTNFSTQKINLLGYSLGGRVCLQMIESIP